jgi:hypothetical protein
MVRIAETQITQKLVELAEASPPRKILRRTAKAAAFGPTERNAVTGAGAPW